MKLNYLFGYVKNVEVKEFSNNPGIDFFETYDRDDFWCKDRSEHTKLIMKEDG